MEIVLYQPEIPPNTGNIIRLCANVGAGLHLIKPLGFNLSDKQVARAGLDYHDMARIHVHESWELFLSTVAERKLWALSTRGTTRYDQAVFGPDDLLLFGPETRGLPREILESIPMHQRLRLPMCPGNRSLNLSNTVAVVAYEAWQQSGFLGGA